MKPSQWITSVLTMVVLGVGLVACESEPDIEAAGLYPDVPEIYQRDVLATPQRVTAAAYDVMANNPYAGIRVMSRQAAFEPTGSAVTRSPGGVTLPPGADRVAGVREVVSPAEASILVLVQPITEEVTRITIRRTGDPDSANNLTVMSQILSRLEARAQGDTSLRQSRVRDNLWGSEPSDSRLVPAVPEAYLPEYGIPREQRDQLYDQREQQQEREQRLNQTYYDQQNVPMRDGQFMWDEVTTPQRQWNLNDSPTTGDLIIPDEQPGGSLGTSTQGRGEIQQQPGRLGPVRLGQPGLQQRLDEIERNWEQQPQVQEQPEAEQPQPETEEEAEETEPERVSD